MNSMPILPGVDIGPDGPAWRWVARAEQARRVAGLLSPADAEIAEAYAIECEVKALRQVSGALRRHVLAA